MQIARVISLLPILGIVFGNPANPNSYKQSLVRDIADEDIRKFYTDFYDHHDGEENADDRKSTIDDYPDYTEELTDDKHTQKSNEENTKSVETDDSSASLKATNKSVVRKDPTFVLSKLLFHLAQLPL